MNYYPSNCPSLPEPTCGACPIMELGRVRAVWIQNQSYVWSDIYNPAEWASAIASGNVFLFPYVNGSKDSSDNTADGYGNTPTVTCSKTIKLTVHDPMVQQNIPFWNALQNNNQWLVGYKTETLGYISNVPATFSNTSPIAADVTKSYDIMITITFVQNNEPVPFVPPTSVFAC
jgi:hypothetical protein